MVFAGFNEEGREVGSKNIDQRYYYNGIMTWQIYIYAVGPLCQIRETAASENIRQRCSTLPQYIATLREVPGTLCNPGQPGTLVWTPDENTTDTVYYQVIHVLCQLFQSDKKSRQYC